MIPKGGKRKALKRTRKTMSECRLNSQKIINSLQEEIDVIKEEMFKKEEYIEQLHNQLTNERKKNEEAVSRYSHATHEYFNELQINKKENDCKHTEIKFKALELEKESLNQSKITAEERLIAIGERCKQLEFQIRETQCKLDKSESDKFISESHQNQSQNDLNESKREIKTLKTELEELRGFKRKIKAENYETKLDQMSSENIKLKDSYNKVTEEITKSYSEMQKLKDQNFEFKSQVSELKQTNSQLNKFLSQTKDELDEKSLKLFEYENELSALRYEFKRNERTQRKQDEHFTNSQLQIAELKISELNKIIENLCEEIDQLKRDSDVTDEDPKEQIINLHQANDQLREDLEETRFKLDEQLRVNSRINYLLEEATANTFARQEERSRQPFKDTFPNFNTMLLEGKIPPPPEDLNNDLQEIQDNFENLSMNELKDRLLVLTEQTRQLDFRKRKLDNIYEDIKELRRESDLQQTIDYILILFNIISCMNSAKLNQAEMGKNKIESIIQIEKRKTECIIASPGSRLYDKGTLMKRRYEEARAKLQSYQKLLKNDVKKSKSIDHDLNSITDANIASDYAAVHYQTNPNYQDYNDKRYNSSKSSSFFETLPKASNYFSLKRNGEGNKKEEKMLLLTETSMNPDDNENYVYEGDTHLNSEMMYKELQRSLSPNNKDEYDKENCISPNIKINSNNARNSKPEVIHTFGKEVLKKNDIKLSSCPVIFTDEEGETSPEIKRDVLVLRDKFNRQYVIRDHNL